MNVMYRGGRKGQFRIKGPLTGVIYCVVGTGHFVKDGMDPKDCLGAGGHGGLCSLKEYELVE